MAIAKGLFFSDLHAPFQPEEASEWIYKVVREHSGELTHVIFGGDLFEADAASKWGNENGHDLLDEYESAADFLDNVSGELGGSTKLIWLLGNHDDNIQAQQRLDKRVRRAAHWNHSQYKDSFNRWRQIPYGKSRECTFELGQLIFKHGVSTNEKMESLEFNNLCGGHAHRLVLGGHTHRPIHCTRAMRTTKIPDNVYYANPGTLGPTNPEWTKRIDTSAWGPGAIYFEALLGRACMPTINWEMELLNT